MASSEPGFPGEILVPDDELEIRATRSGGPGGQHVNTSSTRIEVRWNVERSPSITEAQRGVLRANLGRRIDASGFLRVVSSETRSQARNREAAIARLRAVVIRGLVVQAPRKPTRVPKAAKVRRLSDKRRRSGIKERRRPVGDDD